jgi:hypothetical protein
MKTQIKYFFAIAVLSLLPLSGQAQQPEMADALRADGKIYVLVAIILIILAGFITYLLLIDKKIKKLEKLVSEKRSHIK